MEDFDSIDTQQRILMMKEDSFLLFLDQFYKKVVANNQAEPEWVDEKTALSILGLRSKTTLWQMRNTGKIAYSKMGAKIILYRRSSLIEYIEKHEQQTF